MTYNEAIDYIHSVSNFFCKPGLERIKVLCDALGNPQDSLKFVHVAGTNGKGSFCAMLSNVLKEAGYKIGTYTSPYILRFNERIMVSGEPIADNELANICETVKNACETMQDKPTEFEVITAIGFEYFKRQNCDIVILECGLGGRFDATNIINTPLLSVITGIDFDHQNFLGNTIKQIAYEKAGIIKSNVPCLWCGDNKEAFEVISNEAKNNNSDLIICDHSEIVIKKATLEGTVFNFKEYENVFLPLISLYQPNNAVNVLYAVKQLLNSGFEISYENVLNGLKNTVWHARFEVINKNPLIIFDGGHNKQGVSEAVKSIKYYFKDTKVNVLTGVMSDKDYNFIAKEISSIAKKVYCITPNNPRALNAHNYADIFNNNNVEALPFENIFDALKTAMNDCINGGNSLICLGSLYMYSDIIKYLS